MSSRSAPVVFGLANVVAAVVVMVGVFAGLPARWAPVDIGAVAVASIEVVSGAGLLLGTAWARRVARVASGVVLGIGMGLVTTLALTASWLRGVYGPVGFGGAVVLSLVAALAVPYLVVLPLVQFLWFAPERD